MELIGDLERAFASAIYPNRVLIALGGLALALALGILAWRRRWDAPVRRHPGRALVAAAVAAVFLGPIAWYLGSPLFLSSTIDEPAPVVAAEASPSVPPAPSSRPTPSVVATAPPSIPPEPTATPSPVQLTGAFAGADDFHFGRGRARLLETADGTFTLRLEDFAVRNGPDLYVYLSPSTGGYADGAVEVGRLKADRGNQNYPVPPGTDVRAVHSVVIWCKQFSVLFATAQLG